MSTHDSSAPQPPFTGVSAAPPYVPAPYGAAPASSVTRPRTLENPEIALRERAVLAMIRGDEAAGRGRGPPSAQQEADEGADLGHRRVFALAEIPAETGA
jgi:hypothetical protein